MWLGALVEGGMMVHEPGGVHTDPTPHTQVREGAAPATLDTPNTNMSAPPQPGQCAECCLALLAPHGGGNQPLFFNIFSWMV